MKLTFYTNKGEKLTEVYLKEGDRKVVGRAPEVDIHIPLKSISRKHAEFIVKDGKLWVKDLGSANGVIIDGVRVEGPVVVYPENRLFLGLIEVVYEKRSGEEVRGVNVTMDKSFSPQYIKREDKEARVNLKGPFIPRLVGRDGKWRGKEFILEKDTISIGRVKDNDIMIDDPSISRKHAKLVRMGEQYILFDLRSSNGTWVNNEKVTKYILQGGENIRFGDITFSYQIGESLSTDMVPGRKVWVVPNKKLILGVVIGIVIFAFVLISYIVTRPGEKTNKSYDPFVEMRRLETEIEKKLSRAKVEMNQKNWNEAIKFYEEVLKIDPLNEAAQKGIKKTKQEKENERLMKKATQLLSVGGDPNLIKELLQQIPKDSIYYSEAVIHLRNINRKIALSFLNKGLRACKDRDYLECYKNLCSFFLTWPLEEKIPEFSKIKRSFENAEKQLEPKREYYTRKGIEVSKCNIEEVVKVQLGEIAILADYYPDPYIRKGIELFVEGNSNQSEKWLGTLLKKKSYKEQVKKIEKIIEYIRLISSSATSIYQYVATGELDSALNQLMVLKESESRLLPPEIQSKFLKDSINILSKAYYEKGYAEFQVARYKNAFQYWIQGKRIEPNNRDILQGLLHLEEKAIQFCGRAQYEEQNGNINEAITSYNECLEITEESSPLHKKAKEALARLKK